ncbi:NAD-dependent epimerase/dehydratase family protein [Pseudomonadales bacterium]|nr:NAD-dependent epimerase/dehydratase family protein [Pseudomonadales bacterium]
MSRSKKILITGSNGFVGRALYDELRARDYDVRGSVRDLAKFVGEQSNVVVGSLDNKTDWEGALGGCTTVIHLAGRAHIFNDRASDPASDFRRVNTEGTINLAEQAVVEGVERFIFVSSIGVNGSKSCEVPITAGSDVNPHSPYAKSKLDAEVGLRKIACKSNMEVVIVRPPAIYGIDAPGNFGLIEAGISKGIPLPFGSIVNRRSLIYLRNLTSFLAVCIEHQEVGGELFVIDDNNDLSTPEIVLVMAGLSDKRARIIKFPQSILSFLLRAIGKDKVRESLMENFQIDSSATRALTGWTPPFNPRDFFQSYLISNSGK